MRSIENRSMTFLCLDTIYGVTYEGCVVWSAAYNHACLRENWMRCSFISLRCLCFSSCFVICSLVIWFSLTLHLVLSECIFSFIKAWHTCWPSWYSFYSDDLCLWFTWTYRWWWMWFDAAVVSVQLSWGSWSFVWLIPYLITMMLVGMRSALYFLKSPYCLKFGPIWFERSYNRIQ